MNTPKETFDNIAEAKGITKTIRNGQEYITASPTKLTKQDISNLTYNKVNSPTHTHTLSNKITIENRRTIAGQKTFMKKREYYRRNGANTGLAGQYGNEQQGATTDNTQNKDKTMLQKTRKQADASTMQVMDASPHTASQPKDGQNMDKDIQTGKAESVITGNDSNQTRTIEPVGQNVGKWENMRYGDNNEALPTEREQNRVRSVAKYDAKNINALLTTLINNKVPIRKAKRYGYVGTDSNVPKIAIILDGLINDAMQGDRHARKELLDRAAGKPTQHKVIDKRELRITQALDSIANQGGGIQNPRGVEPGVAVNEREGGPPTPETPQKPIFEAELMERKNNFEKIPGGADE